MQLFPSNESLIKKANRIKFYTVSTKMVLKTNSLSFNYTTILLLLNYIPSPIYMLLNLKLKFPSLFILAFTLYI